MFKEKSLIYLIEVIEKQTNLQEEEFFKDNKEIEKKFKDSENIFSLKVPYITDEFENWKITDSLIKLLQKIKLFREIAYLEQKEISKWFTFQRIMGREQFYRAKKLPVEISEIIEIYIENDYTGRKLKKNVSLIRNEIKRSLNENLNIVFYFLSLSARINKLVEKLPIIFGECRKEIRLLKKKQFRSLQREIVV